VELYETYVKVLLRDWHLARGVDGTPQPASFSEQEALLAELGDPRPEVMTLAGMAEALCEVPAGAFWMGEEDEKHEVTIPYTYRIARFPVVVAQYREFLIESRREPEDPDCLLAPANTPVVWVSWHDALAFCDWLTERWREEGRLAPEERVTLPSEAEWEKAARGTDGRIFPWGDEEGANRANFNNTGIDGVSAVGCFPNGVSLFGCEEMSGNVDEWSRSAYEDYPYEPRDGREELTKDSSRVVRGGSFRDWLGDARAAYRDGAGPAGLDGGLGFRIVVRPFSSGL